MEKTMAAIAYLDILGFAGYCQRDVNVAIDLLQNYKFVVDQKITDESFPYDSQLEKFAEERLITSFDYFLPFSDSLFIQSSTQSSSPDLFLRQLSHFIIACFTLTSTYYSNPSNPHDPAKVEGSNIEFNGKKLIRNPQTKYYPPLLFRGGISFGEAVTFQVNAINGRKLTPITNIAGKALVKVVKELEPTDKGPRLFLDCDFYQELNDDTRKYCRKIMRKDFASENLYEVLWPAFDDDISNDLLCPAINFCIAYKNKDWGVHYYEFVKLVINSLLKFDTPREQIEKLIQSKCKNIEDQEKFIELLGIL